jgi:PAS domain S-box-containing protein
MADASAQLQHSEPPGQKHDAAAHWHTAELTLVDNIYAAIASAPSLDGVLTAVATQLGALLDATSAYISLYEAETQIITVVAEYIGPDANDEERISDLGTAYFAPRDFPGVEAMLHSGQPRIHYRDDPTLSDAIREHQARYGGQTVLVLPLTLQGEVLAFLALWDSRCHRVFAPEEIALCQRIARHAAVAIHNARLYTQARQELAERELVEAALRRSEAHNRALLDAIPDLIFHLDRQGTYLAAKADRDHHLIAPVEQLLGRNIGAFLPPDVTNNLLACIARALANNEMVLYEYTLSLAGELHEFEARIVACGADDVLVIARDITARKQAERALIAAREAAEAAARLKGAFLANMSHEIRTPMNGLLGMLDVLRSTPLNAEQHEYIHTAHVAGQALLTLLNDILDLSKIEAGKLELSEQPFDLPQLVQNVLALYRGPASQRKLHLGAQLAPNLPTWVLGDSVRVRQVLTNLLDNAIKFTHAGSVLLDVSCDDRAAQPELVFAVRDTGIGMSAEACTQLFQPFSQIDTSSTRRYAGTGLGLAICRQLAHLMGGTLSVVSSLERGSTFSLRIPLRGAQCAPSVSVAAPDKALPTALPGIAPILVVEDNPVNQLVVQRQLELLGYTVEVAPDGQAAIEAAQARAYSLIFMDLQMPYMDGFATTAAIRAYEGDKRHTPIIALTAHVLSGEEARCIAAGMDGYLAKPLTPQALGQVLARWITLAQPSPQP